MGTPRAESTEKGVPVIFPEHPYFQGAEQKERF
jgi:hypothetical protein